MWETIKHVFHIIQVLVLITVVMDLIHTCEYNWNINVIVSTLYHEVIIIIIMSQLIYQKIIWFHWFWGHWLIPLLLFFSYLYCYSNTFVFVLYTVGLGHAFQKSEEGFLDEYWIFCYLVFWYPHDITCTLVSLTA